MTGMKSGAALAAVLLLAGCTSDKVVFVTSTSLGINLDTTPGTVSVAYDRTEGYIAPIYQNGTLPPVMASIDTDGRAIAPEIRQLYATGPAAIIVGGGEAREPENLTRGNRKSAFVGTSTTVGLKAAFTTGVPESFNFGYKRKEYSLIPLGCEAAGGAGECDLHAVDLYPSVIGSFDTSVSIPSANNTTFKTRQFIATGAAATALAPKVRDDFQTIATESIAFQAGKREGEMHLGQVEDVINRLSPEGTFSTDLLTAYAKAANVKKAGAVSDEIASAQSAADLRRRLRSDDGSRKALSAAMPPK